jgi:hypothetical protein
MWIPSPWSSVTNSSRHPGHPEKPSSSTPQILSYDSSVLDASSHPNSASTTLNNSKFPEFSRALIFHTLSATLYFNYGKIHIT